MIQNTEAILREVKLLEHTLQQTLAQKQSLQFEINEITTALQELEKTKDEVYRIMGNIMMQASKEKLQKELSERKKSLELHIKAFEKQEKITEEKLQKLQSTAVDKNNS